ncbi:glycoside hydrolase family 13 protein [Streptomyces marispadix]|uniref:glycoside hydrolase family 13 protein n=1 Tax=Streptomyces marispadix TaxID=2922868 RepID=UPI0035569E9A
MTDTTAPHRQDGPDWWRQAAVYQIYPRSFADSDGDGLGDIRGITSRLPYLAELGVDAVWLSPFYPSALADGGYDVADYRDVDPRLGTLDDFDEMVAEAHRFGIKVIIDIVPNHTSNDHEWFQAALRAEPGSPERDRYIFRQGRGENGELPPADWESAFGGPAWSRLPDGWWYMHLFAPEQPDLNWENPEVRADFRKTLRFWSDRGVDGYRIDVANALMKDLDEPLRDMGPRSYDEQMAEIEDGTHPFWDRDEVHEIYREWREVFNEYDPPRVGIAEAWVKRHRLVLYARPEGLGQAFNFEYLKTGWDARELRSVIDESLRTAQDAGASATWVLSNHDVIRHASRFALPEGADTDEWLLSGGTRPEADAERGLRRARAATMLELALPGSAYMYQGEELGLPEVASLTEDELQDPVWERSSHTRKGRDGCRVPLPWTRTGPSFGFGTEDGESPWLPQPAYFGELSAEAQEGEEDSTLELYREALRLRHKLVGTDESLTWLSDEETASDGVLHFVRPDGWHCLTNFGTETRPLPEGEVLLSSGPLNGEGLPGETTVWLRDGAADG